MISTYAVHYAAALDLGFDEDQAHELAVILQKTDRS